MRRYTNQEAVMRAHKANKKSPSKKVLRKEVTTDHLPDEDLEQVAGGIETVPLPEVKRTKKKKPPKKKVLETGPSDDTWM